MSMMPTPPPPHMTPFHQAPVAPPPQMSPGAQDVCPTCGQPIMPGAMPPPGVPAMPPMPPQSKAPPKKHAPPPHKSAGKKEDPKKATKALAGWRAKNPDGQHYKGK